MCQGPWQPKTASASVGHWVKYKVDKLWTWVIFDTSLHYFGLRDADNSFPPTFLNVTFLITKARHYDLSAGFYSSCDSDLCKNSCSFWHLSSELFLGASSSASPPFLPYEIVHIRHWDGYLLEKPAMEPRYFWLHNLLLVTQNMWSYRIEFSFSFKQGKINRNREQHSGKNKRLVSEGILVELV